MDSIRAQVLFESYLEKFWGKATLMFVSVINRLPSSAVHNLSSFKWLDDTSSSYSHLKVFGCACFVLLNPYEHTKLEPRASLYCFLSYGTEHQYFHCWDPISKRLRISHHVTF